MTLLEKHVKIKSIYYFGVFRVRKILFAFLGGMFLNVCAVFVAEGRTLDCGEPVSGQCRAGCFYDGTSRSCIRCSAGTYRASWGSGPCKDCTKPSEVIEIKGEYEFEFLNGDEYTGYDTDTCPWLIRCSAGRYWRYSETSKTARCQVCGRYGSTSGVPDSTCYDMNACDSGDCDVIGQIRVDYDDNVYIEVNTTDNDEYACKPKVYTMTLNKNTNLVELNGMEYENFSYDVECNGDNDQYAIPNYVLQPTQDVKIFEGYAKDKSCTEKIFASNGNLLGNEILNKDMELYACWNNPDIIIEYHRSDSVETRTQTCKIDDAAEEPSLCLFENNADMVADGKTFSNYICRINADTDPTFCTGTEIYYQPKEQIPLVSTKIDIYINSIDCPQGYYCTPNKNSCPIGTTSATGSTSVSACYMQSGQSGTKFCDKNGCFYLPTGIGNISYNPS